MKLIILKNNSEHSLNTALDLLSNFKIFHGSHKKSSRNYLELFINDVTKLPKVKLFYDDIVESVDIKKHHRMG